MTVLLLALLVGLPCFLLWSGRGRVGSARHARRYPEMERLRREADRL